MANPNLGFTPGVYINELDAFGNSVVPAPTAVPAFIGYTQNTSYNGQDITFQPIKITCLADFTTLFGSTAPQVEFGVTAATVMQSSITAALASATAANGAIGVSTTVNTDLGTAITAIGAATTANIGTQITTVTGILNGAITPTAPATVNQPDIVAATAVLNYANMQYLNLSSSTAGPAGTALTAVNAVVNTAAKADYTAIYNHMQAATSQKAIQALITLAQNVTPSVTPIPADEKTAKDDLEAYGTSLNTAFGDVAFWSNGVAYSIGNTTVNYRLYSAIKFFYENGGGTAYVYSIGGYTSNPTLSDITPFQNALDLLVKETEPTMLVIPDAVELKVTTGTTNEAIYANCYTLQNAMISHCGVQQNRIAILDIPGAWTEPIIGDKSYETFRNQVNPAISGYNSYAAAYYPWLNTTVYQAPEVSGLNIDTTSATNYATVFAMLCIDQTALTAASTGVINPKMVPYINAFALVDTAVPANSTAIGTNPSVASQSVSAANSALYNLSTSYQLLINAILGQMNLMPPASAMAGLYTAVDNSEGVWYAPANIGVQSVISPAFSIDDNAQADLNVPIDGKSICAIRSFVGRGTLVWGARTLDGNSDDWRYINVRRTMMYIEQSVKDAAFTYVFAPNVASTWIDVQSMITNFLTGLWSQGGLAGSKPELAFSVSVGLGSTMTSQDILDGYMRVSVKVAISHPAEFIVITFEQQMQS